MNFFLVLFIVINTSAMNNTQSIFFPIVKVDKETQKFIDIIESRQWQKGNKSQIRLFGVLTAGSIGECRYHMDQYRLTANNYQQAAHDPMVLQAWLSDIPPDVRDIQVKRFFNEMCFTNKLNVIKLLQVWGLCVDRLGSEFIARLEKRARAKNYHELVEYLTALSKSSKSISNPTKCSDEKPL